MIPSYADNFTQRLGGFEIERTPTTAPVRLPDRPEPEPEDEEVVDLPTAVGRLLAAKAHPFSVSGRVPLKPTDLVLFFRSQSNATHSIEFPVDPEYDTPPAFDVLIATCQPYPDSPRAPTGYPYGAPPMPRPTPSSPSVLAYPLDLPFSTTLELTNRPILDAVRNTLFPSLIGGNYLLALRDRLEVIVAGSRKRPALAPSDGRVATIVVTLPVRFKGGSLIVSPAPQPSLPQSHAEPPSAPCDVYRHASKTAVAGIDWVAYNSDCTAEVELVRKGVRIDLHYAVHLRSFGPSGAQPDPLITPSEEFRNLLGGVLNLTRGRKIGFYLSGEYGVSPSESLADSLVPLLNGGDSLLYHSLKLYQLTPELHWTAGGFIWPSDKMIDLSNDTPPPVSPLTGHRRHLSGSPQPTVPPVRGTFGNAPYGGLYSGQAGSQYGGSQVGAPYGTAPLGNPALYGQQGLGGPQNEVEALKARVEGSGAAPLAQADITILADWDETNGGSLVGVGKERVPFLSGGELGKLVVNVLMVVYVA